MTPLSSFKPYHIICLALFLITTFGCSSTSCPDCKDDQSINLNANLQILDKTSRQDLFFGKQAKYNLNQLKLTHLVNGRHDSVSAVVKIDSAKRIFNINVFYQKDVDTVVMQIANAAPDTLFLSTGLSDQCCANVFISAVTLGKNLIYSGLDVAAASKAKQKVITVLK